MEERCRSERKQKRVEGGAVGVDDEFNPILLNTFDDEQTLDEEEALEPTEDPQTELQNLQREGDMPLEELLKLCGYTSDGKRENESDCSENGDKKVVDNYQTPVKRRKKVTKSRSDRLEITRPNEDSVTKVELEEVKPVVKVEEPEQEEEEEEDDDMEDEKPERSALCQLYDDILPDPASGGGSSRPLRSVLRPQSEEEDEDNDYSPDEEELKKTIMVGSNYQAYIPEGLCKYDDALPYENDDKLLWDPTSLLGDQIQKYLTNAQEVVVKGAQGVNAIPVGAHTRDDEQALYLLMQCDNNMEEALRRMKMNVSGPMDSMSLWSEEECRNFETGLRMYGKNFHLIHLNKVRTRSVGELVQFYYLWKKTERHDIFAHKARLEKKKYTLHPGITDYMDRFLEDQDSTGGTESAAAAGSTSRDRSSSPNVHCLIYADHKRHNRSATTSPSGHTEKKEPVTEKTSSPSDKGDSTKDTVKSEPNRGGAEAKQSGSPPGTVAV